MYSLKMFRFECIINCSGSYLPVNSFLHKAVLCTLRNSQQLGCRYGFRTVAFLKNRDDDLTAVMDPLEFHSASTPWKKQELLSRVNDLLHCSKDELERIYKTNKKSLSTIVSKTITDNIALLLNKGVTGKSIISFPKILSIRTGELADKLTVLGKLKDLIDINHIVPLLPVSLDVLERVVEISQRENIEHGNRIYFLEAKTGVDCDTIARYFATHIHIYRVSLEKFKANLDYCLQYLEPLDIVKNLSTLAFASSSISERIRLLENSPLEQVKPWMIAVPGPVLGRTFDKALEKGTDLKFKNPLTEIWYDHHILQKIEDLLDCSEEEAIIVYEACEKTEKTVSLLENIKFLKEMNIRKETIIKIPMVLTLSREDLSEKLVTLSKLEGLRDLNDVIPLCMLNDVEFEEIVRTLNDEGLQCGSNRIYHFANKTAVNPTDVAKYLSRRMFMFRIPENDYLLKLDLFLTNMDGKDILTDLWVFKCSPNSVAKRIEQMKNEIPGRKIKPWMVRSDIHLEYILKSTKEKNDILGENESIIEYFCQRLEFEQDVVHSIIAKCPSVSNVRVTKVKKVFDYLLDELDYTPYDIALTPKILKHSLQTTRKRMEQLKEIGYRPRSLAIVCASKRVYALYVEWLVSKERKEKVSTCNAI